MSADVKEEYEKLCSATSRLELEKSDAVSVRVFCKWSSNTQLLVYFSISLNFFWSSNRNHIVIFCLIFLVTEGSTLKGVLVGTFLIALISFSGLTSLTIYTISILNETGTEIDPKVSVITITCIQIIGSFIASIFVDYWGRKILLSASCFGSAVSLFSFATFAYLYKNDYSMTSFSWIPVTSMAIYIFSINAGICPLPFVIIAEMLPPKVRENEIVFPGRIFIAIWYCFTDSSYRFDDMFLSVRFVCLCKC